MPEDHDIVTVPVERAAGRVHIDARRMARNRRRDGATMRAAGRLALYVLRRFVRTHNLTMVTDIDVSIHDDIMRDDAYVIVDVRTVRLPKGIEANFRIEPGTHNVRFAVPR